MLHHPTASDSDAIGAILASGLYIVLAITRCDGPPHLVSMNYGHHDGCIYLHSGLSGSKVTAWTATPQVSFTVVSNTELVTGATACRWSMRFRSLVGQGRIERVTDPAECLLGLDALMRHYGSEVNTYDSRVMEQTAIWRLTVEQISVREKT